MVRWFIIVGLALTVLVGGLVYFNYFRGKMIAQFFANNKPPPVSRQRGRSEVGSDSESVDRGRRSRRRAPGQRHLGRQRPHHRDPVHRGRQREGGHAAGAAVRRARAGRPRQLQGAGDRGAALARSRQAARWRASSARRRPSTPRRPRSTRPRPASPRPRLIISQKLVRAPFDGELGVRKVEVGQYLTAGTPDRLADRPVDAAMRTSP